MTDEARFRSGETLFLDALSGPRTLLSGAADVFLVRMDAGEPATRLWLGVLTPDEPFFPVAPVAEDGRNSSVWVLSLTFSEESRIGVASASASDWLQWLRTRAEYQSGQKIEDDDVPAVLAVLIRRVQEKERSRLRLMRENNEVATRELGEKIAALGALAGLSLADVAAPVASGNTLARAARKIAEAYRLPLDEAALAGLERRPGSPEEQLREFAAATGWRMRRVELEADVHARTALPLLAFRKDSGAPVVLYPHSDGGRIYDPRTDATAPLTERETATLARSAYCFYELFPRKTLTKKVLFAFIFANARPVLTLLGIVGALAALLGLLGPLATEYITGRIIPTANYTELYQLAGLLIVLTACGAGFQLIPALVMLVFSSRQFERFQAAVYDHILRVPVSSFAVCDAGDMTQRVLGAAQIQGAVFNIVSGQFLGSIFNLFSLAMMFYYSPRLALPGMALVIIYAGGVFLLSRVNLKPLTEHAAADGRFSGLLRQFLEGMGKIRTAAAETRVISRCMDEISILVRQQYRISRNSALQAVFSTAFPTMISLLFYALIGGVWKGEMELPAFLAFMAAFQNFQAGVTGLAGGLWSLLAIRPDVDRILPILQTATEDVEGGQAPGLLDGTVELSHVTFRYRPDAPSTIEDVSLRADPGEFVAIVGPSGAGKSTLVRLLLGFARPESGGVYYSGKDLVNLDVRAVRRQLGVILQNSRVITGSILENIVIGTEYTVDDAWTALRRAAMDAAVKAMPMGIHTIVTPETVSGGQQQRILIARALVGNPAVVILDESTSALDNITQETVKENLGRLRTTRIVIAHRLSTIVNADRIYVMDKGRVVQTGSYAELMSRDGLFKRLAERQLTNMERP